MYIQGYKVFCINNLFLALLKMLLQKQGSNVLKAKKRDVKQDSDSSLIARVLNSEEDYF